MKQGFNLSVEKPVCVEPSRGIWICERWAVKSLSIANPPRVGGVAQNFQAGGHRLRTFRLFAGEIFLRRQIVARALKPFPTSHAHPTSLAALILDEYLAPPGDIAPPRPGSINAVRRGLWQQRRADEVR